MKRFKTALAGTLIVLGIGCYSAFKAGELHLKEAEPATSVDQDIATQNRINSFFYAALVPKLPECRTGRIGFGGSIVIAARK